MDTWTTLLVIFIVLSAVIIVLMIALSQRGQAQLKLPGKAEMSISFDKGGWQPAQSSPAAPARPPNAATKAWLVAGQHKQWKYVLDGKPQVTIGRHPDNDIWLRYDQMADARHAVITWHGDSGRFRITNLSSIRPTRVNNHAVTWQALGDGNSIWIGHTRLVFHTTARNTQPGINR